MVNKSPNSGNKNLNGLLLFVIIVSTLVVASYFFSDVISKLMFKNVNVKQIFETNDERTRKYYYIQLGAFAEEENAKSMVESLKGKFSSLLIKEDTVYKVILGIYNDSNINSAREKIPEGQDFAEDFIEILRDTNSKIEFVEIMDATLNIVEKFNEQDVSEINIKKFKKWVKDLEDTKDDGSENLGKLKKYILDLEDILTREKVSVLQSEIYDYIFQK